MKQMNNLLSIGHFWQDFGDLVLHKTLLLHADQIIIAIAWSSYPKIASDAEKVLGIIVL